MAIDERLADRVREAIAEKTRKVKEKKMFGGLCFMVNDKMCVCTREGRIMVRVDPARYEGLLEREGTAPMNFTGRTMRGFLFVSDTVLKSKKQLSFWIELALGYNKTAKSSKRSAAKKNVKQ